MASTNSVFVQAIIDCVQERHVELITLLADTYGFDAIDAQKKIAGLTSDEISIVPPEPKKRGRPPKQVVVQEANDEEDLVASLMANSDEKTDKPKAPAKKPKMTAEEREAKKAETKRIREEKAADAKEKKRIAREEAKAAKDAFAAADKEQKRLAKEQDKEQKRLAREQEKDEKRAARFEAFKKEKAEKVAAKRAAKEQEQQEQVQQMQQMQQEQEQEQEEKVIETAPLPQLQILSTPSAHVTSTELTAEEESESEAEAEAEVTEFEIDGKTYYRDDDDLVYENLEEAEVIGTWNSATNTIDPVAEDDEDEE